MYLPQLLKFTAKGDGPNSFRNTNRLNMVGVARFSTVAARLARAKGYRIPHDVALRKPILPTIDNIKVRDDHPLWQFFHKKQFVRTVDELEIQGRSWTVQELRKKSFEDLHALWYVCLREMNKIQREARLYEDIGSSKLQQCMNFEEAVKNSMLAIRQVLTERETGLNNAREEFKVIGEDYLQEFKQSYLESEDVESDLWFDKLERLQYAIFGINATYESVVINQEFIRGIKYISSLYFDKFSPQLTEQDKKIESLNDIVEVYKVFESGSTLEGFNGAIESILEYRESGLVIPASKEIMVIQNLVDEKIKEANEIPEPETAGTLEGSKSA